MGIVTFHTVLDCRFVGNAFTPVAGDARMAGKTEHWLSFFQNVLMGRPMGSMTVDAVSINSGLVPCLGGVDGCTDIPVAVEAYLAGLFFNDILVVGSVRIMAFGTVPLGHGGVGLNVFGRREQIFMALAAELAIFQGLFEKSFSPGLMQTVTARTVAGRERSVQAEPSPFICFASVTGKAEMFLGIDQEKSSG